jgi:AmmeMemoRadiSam system protein A
VTGDKSGVVGYAAIAFYEPGGGQPAADAAAGSLTPQEGEVLLELARKTVDEVVRNKRLPEIDAAGVPESLKELRACFVTLTERGELRGCIGSIFPREPLWQAVIARARSAATEDPRFPPVAPAELGELEIEVSVLTVPGRLEYDSPEELLARLRPGVDGVVLVVGRRQATYLPQVWEKLPDRETFLSHLSEKAGLPSSAWRSPEATILVYQVEAFQQSEM